MIAEHPNCSPDLLRTLASSNEFSVCRYVATHPNCPSDILAQPLQNKDIRLEVAVCASTPSETLKQLANDNDANIRYAVAAHPNTQPAVLMPLLQDPDGNVRLKARLCFDTRNDIPEHLRTMAVLTR